MVIKLAEPAYKIHITEGPAGPGRRRQLLAIYTLLVNQRLSCSLSSGQATRIRITDSNQSREFNPSDPQDMADLPGILTRVGMELANGKYFLMAGPRGSGF